MCGRGMARVCVVGGVHGRVGMCDRGDMCGRGGHEWWWWGMHDRGGGACMVGGMCGRGMCGGGGHAWQK